MTINFTKSLKFLRFKHGTNKEGQPYTLLSFLDPETNDPLMDVLYKGDKAIDFANLQSNGKVYKVYLSIIIGKYTSIRALSVE